MKIEEVEKKVNEMGYNTEWITSEAGNRYLCANVQGVSVNFRKLRAMNSETVKGEFFPDAVNDIIYFAEAYTEDIKSGGANINALVDLALYTATIERLNVRDLRRVRSGWNSDGYIYPLLTDLSEQEARQAHRQMWDEIATAECGFY